MAIATATNRYYNQQQALIRAGSAYNSGGDFASMSYASNVYAIAVGVNGSISEQTQTFHPAGHLYRATPLPAITRSRFDRIGDRRSQRHIRTYW